MTLKDGGELFYICFKDSRVLHLRFETKILGRLGNENMLDQIQMFSDLLFVFPKNCSMLDRMVEDSDIAKGLLNSMA